MFLGLSPDPTRPPPLAGRQQITAQVGLIEQAGWPKASWPLKGQATLIPTVTTVVKTRWHGLVLSYLPQRKLTKELEYALGLLADSEPHPTMSSLLSLLS